MDGHLSSLVFNLSLCALIISVILLITVYLKVCRAKGKVLEKIKNFYTNSIFLKIFLIIIAAVIFFFLKPHTGQKGQLLAFLFGFILPSLVFFLMPLSEYNKEDWGGDFLFSKKTSAILFLSAYLFGFLILAKIYGIKAISLWQWTALGLAVNLMWLKIGRVSPHLINTGLIAIAFTSMQILGTWHFVSSPLGIWIGPFIMLAVIASMLITMPLMLKEENNGPRYHSGLLASVIFLALSTLAIFSVLGKLVYFLPLLASIITAWLFIILMEAEKNKEKNISLASIILLLLIGCLWFAFKFALGFGVSLTAVGFIFLIIADSGDEKHKEKINTVIGLCGITALLYASLRIFLQITSLYYKGIVLGDANFLTGIFIGSFLGLFIEGSGLFKIKDDYSFLKKIENFAMILVFASLAFFFCGAFLYEIGIIGALIGIVIFAFLSLLLAISQNDASWNLNLNPVWIFFSIICIIGYPLLNTSLALTRLGKIEILAGFGILAILAHIINSRKHKPNEEGFLMPL